MRLSTAAAVLRQVGLGRSDSETAVLNALLMDQADGVALLDRDGIVLQANTRLTELTTAALNQAIWPNLPKPASSLRPKLQAGQAGEVMVIAQPGRTRRIFRLTLLPVAGGGGLFRVSDRTREQDLEDQLGQAQRLQAVGELAGGIAHDFNNLLTAVLGATDDLRARGTISDDQSDLDLIQHSAERGAGLVRQLLAFSRQQMLQPRVVALNEAVQGNAGLLRRMLGPGVLLDLALEEPGRQVCIDPTQLHQVLMNLAVNAGHAMPNGGRLTIATGHVLRLRRESFGGETVPPGRYASLSIADTGEGIPPDILPRIFEPFFTTKSRTGGTGLGLSTVHGIVRQSGGYMAVETEAGRGTRFEILLPRHEEAPWQTCPPAAPAAPRAPVSRTLLLVDDEAPVRTLAARVLTRAGWQVVTAICSEDALDLVEAGNLGPVLACVISDVVMPGLDGPALVRHLRRAQPGLPAILMSGYADADLRRALQADDIRFLGKPFAMAELADALSGLLSKAQAA